MKKLIALTGAIAILGAVVLPAPASAQNAAAAAGVCEVTLPTWPTTEPGSVPGNGCEGQAVGASTLGDCVGLCQFNATVSSYEEECVAQEPPLTGTASGQLFLNGTYQGDYDWTRVGLVAVVLVDPPGTGAGAGVAAFAPNPVGLPTCDNPGSLNATVVGVLAGAGV